MATVPVYGTGDIGCVRTMDNVPAHTRRDR